MSRDESELKPTALDLAIAMPGIRPPWDAEDEDWSETIDDQRAEARAWDEAERVAEWTARWRIEVEVARLRTALASRPPSSEYSFDPDVERLTHLLSEVARLAVPPAGWQPEDSTPSGPAQPALVDDPFTDALAAQLTPAQRQLWRWIEQGKKQSWIAEKLDVSQPAISKQERQVRTIVEALYEEMHGRPYPWPGGVGKPRRLGVRGPGR